MEEMIEAIYDKSNNLGDEVSNMLCNRYKEYKGTFDVAYNRYDHIVIFIFSVDCISNYYFDYHMKLEFPRNEILDKDNNYIRDYIFWRLSDGIESKFLNRIKNKELWED